MWRRAHPYVGRFDEWLAQGAREHMVAREVDSECPESLDHIGVIATDGAVGVDTKRIGTPRQQKLEKLELPVIEGADQRPLVIAVRRVSIAKQEDGEVVLVRLDGDFERALDPLVAP